MSKPDVSASKCTGSDEADKDCICDHCDAAPPLSIIPKNHKKRYVPPAPDSDTFARQQDFLDSLKPMSLDGIDKNFRKCPFCWKPYGEAADPGLDNTEQPVKLRCNHIFGDKCLASMFRIPEISKAEFDPLSFTSISRGYVLGQKLHAFVRSYSKNLCGDTETFLNMLEESIQETAQSTKGEDLFGNYWWPIIYRLLVGARDIYDITFFENAVVLDFMTTKSKEGDLPHYSSTQFNAFSPSNAFTGYVPDTTWGEPWASASSPELNTSSIPPQNSFSSYVPVNEPSSSGAPPPLKLHLSSSHLPNTKSSTKELTAPPQGPSISTPLSTFGQGAKDSNQQPTGNLSDSEKAKSDKFTALDVQTKQNVEALEALAHANFTDHQKHMRERLHRKKLHVQNLIARKMADIYGQFSEQHIDAINGYEGPTHCTEILDVMLTIDSDQIAETSYEVPSMVLNPITQDTSSRDKFTLMVMRDFCTNGQKSKNEGQELLPAPKSLWWRCDPAEPPDDCPICRKILFRKPLSMVKRYSNIMF